MVYADCVTVWCQSKCIYIICMCVCIDIKSHWEVTIIFIFISQIRRLRQKEVLAQSSSGERCRKTIAIRYMNSVMVCCHLYLLTHPHLKKKNLILVLCSRLCSVPLWKLSENLPDKWGIKIKVNYAFCMFNTKATT